LISALSAEIKKDVSSQRSFARRADGFLISALSAEIKKDVSSQRPRRLGGENKNKPELTVSRSDGGFSSARSAEEKVCVRLRCRRLI